MRKRVNVIGNIWKFGYSISFASKIRQPWKFSYCGMGQEIKSPKSYKLKERKWIVNDKKDIKDYWNGIVIYTNNHPISKCAIDLKSIVLSVILGIILLSIVCFYTLKINTIYYTPIFLGCVISGCLYFKTEMSSSLIDRLCHISKVTDCERVENSSYSSLFGFNMSCLAFSFLHPN